MGCRLFFTIMAASLGVVTHRVQTINNGHMATCTVHLPAGEAMGQSMCVSSQQSKTSYLSFNSCLNTSASSLSAETRPLTTEIQPLVPLPESAPTTSNSEHSNAPEIPQCVKRYSRNRRKRPKVQKAEIEIKMAPHRPRKSAPIELTTDDEDMITYDVEEEDLEQDPPNKFTIKEDPLNFPKGYLRSLTSSRYRNSRG
ncbi:hypothetical protein TNCV_5035651 [Trichonephila clavipes]|nr:hypothetical protein TNCV_5035651 [Trichonephila clavipes]